MSSAAKAVLGVLAVVLAVVLFLVLRDEGGDTTEPTTVEASVEQTTEGSSGAASGQGAQGTKTPGKPEPPEVATIEVKGGQPVGGVQELSFDRGEEIRFVVESDVADEIHFHGYDIEKEVPAGGSVEFAVPATIEGVFEVELHELVVPIAEITVNP